ncbi:MAG: transposase [Shimia sp.]|nr:transposase [Shimia sp.]
MTRNQSTTANRLTANDVYELTSEVLQEHFELDMSRRDYEASDIWDVLVAAAVQHTTVETACGLLEDAPSPNTVRQAVKAILMDDERLAGLEAIVNQMLVARLPKGLLKRARPCAVDFTDIPYHGQHEADDDHVRRSRAKSGTTHFHSYATVCVVKANRRYTLAITLHRRSDKALDALQRVLDTARASGLRIRRLMLDREFDNNAVVAYLSAQPFPTIMPLMFRGRKGGARRVLTGRKSHSTTYTRQSKTYGTHILPVTIVCRYKKGRFGDHGLQRFAYVTIGHLAMAPHQIAQEYRRRFGIETSYRLMNTLRARTTSTSVTWRLFLVVLALLLLNLWVFVKWQHLFFLKPGPRQILHHLLPLARWRMWLWEIIKQRHGFSLEIIVPTTA